MSNLPSSDESIKTSDKQIDKTLLEYAGSLFLFREMALGVFHQLGNHLHSVSSSLLLIETVAAEERFKHSEIIEQIDRMRRAIRTSLEMLSTIQKRGATLGPILERCYLIEDIVRPVLFYKKRQVKGSNIIIEHSLTNQDYPVFLDPGLVKESIINILDNAIWAVKAHTRTTKKEIFVFVRESATDHTARIDIVDTGIGIPIENYHRLFEPFFTTRRGGTGLGLFFAKQIIKQCGGTLVIARSYPGKGTTVEIKLPLST